MADILAQDVDSSVNQRLSAIDSDSGVNAGVEPLTLSVGHPSWQFGPLAEVALILLAPVALVLWLLATLLAVASLAIEACVSQAHQLASRAIDRGDPGGGSIGGRGWRGKNLGP